MSPIRVGHFARIPLTREPFEVLAIDGGEAWVKDDDGNKMAVPVVDLEYVSFAEGTAWLAYCKRVSDLSSRELAQAGERV